MPREPSNQNNSLRNPMHRLVPQFILDNYQAQNYQGSFQAVCLITDVTGFSRVTDVLAQHGLHGSEVLANGMRQVFDPMIRSVFEYGGHVVGFAGDAITAVFPVSDLGEEAYSKAIASAQAIQMKRLQNSVFVTPYGEFNISVKIGLGIGEAGWKIVISADGQRATYYFRGSAIQSAVSSLSLSKSGEIILWPEVYQTLGEVIRTVQRGKHFLFEGFSGQPPESHEIDLLQPNPEHLRIFCSSEISSYELSGEFRPSVSLFLGMQPESEQGMQLEPFLQKVFKLQDIYGGLFSRVDVGDKGTNLLMFWGAPLARENDVERALNFLLELYEQTQVPLKAGITYRLAYAGYMGGFLQEEYTCYGWGVNLSARLMMAAGPGEIWTDEEVARRAERRFRFQRMGHQIFKGFSQEQSVFKLLNRKEDDRVVFKGKFIGRETELEMLGRFISPIWSGKFAGLLTVVGEPGIGKSRLIDAFQGLSTFSEHKCYWAVCQTDEFIRESLNPFRYWLKRYFNISESTDETENRLAFDEKLNEVIASILDIELSHSLDRTRSCLGELVNLYWSDSLYERLDAQGRYDNTFIALSAFLRAESLRRPLLILIEDAHLLDSDTKAFLQYLERLLTAEENKSYPIALLLTSRATGLEIVFEKAPLEEIQLNELTKADLLRLADDLLNGMAAPSLLKILDQRAEGNPFFIEQIIRYLQEEDKLEQGLRGWQMADEQALELLPTDISAILVSRLDRLNREVREVVQTASVIGREFELNLLSKMLHDDETIFEKIHLGVQAEILSTLTEIRYIFRHALLRDAAYNMQLQAKRQELHRTAVEAFESLYQDQLSSHYSEIAYHSEHGGLREKAKKFYILAGTHATQAYQNNQAIESYTRALALSSIDDIQERIELLLSRVALYRIISDRGGQEQDLATLELLAEKQQNDRNRVIVALRQAEFAFDLGDFPETQRLTESVIKIAESARALDVIASAYRILPLALARQGNIKQAIQIAQIGLQLTRQVGDKESEGQTFNELGLIALDHREIGQARDYFNKSLTLANEMGNRRLEAQVLNNMGIVSGMFENDYVAAKEYYTKALDIVREIGNRSGEGYALGNLGWVASMQGDFERAHNFSTERLTVARESGNRYMETYGLINLGAMLATQGDFSGALTYAEQALNLAHKLGDRSAEAWALTGVGYAELGLGNFKNASERFYAALDIRRFFDQQNLAMELLAALAQVELDKNDPAAALKFVENILLHLTNGGNLEGTEEPLRVYLTVYLTLLENHDPRADQILKDAHSRLREQVGKIQEQRYREMFIQNVPWRRQIDKLWHQAQGKKQQDI